MVKDILRDLEKRMKVSTECFRKELSRLRTGRANINLFEELKVDYFGNLTLLNQVATLGVPDPTLISIKPWDSSLLDSIDKAIRSADLGLNPINNGKMLKVPIPPLDEDRRKELAKHIKVMMEEEKTAFRVMRREAKEKIEDLEKNKEITEDDKYWGYDKLKEIMDEFNKRIEELAVVKEKEILEV